MKIPNDARRAIRELAVEQRPEAERLRRQAIEDVEELREQVAKLRDARRVLAWARELVDSGALADLPLSLPIYVDERTSVQVRPNGALDVQHRGKLMSPKLWNVSNASKLVHALSDAILGRLVERIESGGLWRDIVRLAERRER